MDKVVVGSKKSNLRETPKCKFKIRIFSTLTVCTSLVTLFNIKQFIIFCFKKQNNFPTRHLHVEKKIESWKIFKNFWLRLVRESIAYCNVKKYIELEVNDILVSVLGNHFERCLPQYTSLITDRAELYSTYTLH